MYALQPAMLGPLLHVAIFAEAWKKLKTCRTYWDWVVTVGRMKASSSCDC